MLIEEDNDCILGAQILGPHAEEVNQYLAVDYTFGTRTN